MILDPLPVSQLFKAPTGGYLKPLKSSSHRVPIKNGSGCQQLVCLPDTRHCFKIIVA